MKSLALSMLLATVAVSSSAFAGTKLVSCSNDDATVSVEIYKNTNGSLVAVVSEESVGGSFPTFKYRVIEQARASRGSSVVFSDGAKFSLVLEKPGRKVEGRLSVSDLRLQETVACWL